MPTGQNYATNVPQTTLVSGINASATAIQVQSASGWPAVPFTAVFEIGTSLQEPVDVTAVAGVNWTVTRNIDGTVGFAHGIGATVTHADIGRDFREARSHIDASTNVHGLTGGAAVVGDIQTQTLTNKTLTAPTITGTVPGGATYTTPKIDRPVIGSTAPGSPTGTDLAMSSNAGVLQLRDAAGTSFQVTPPATSAFTNSLFGWTYDTVSAANSITLAAGFIGYSKITLPVLTVPSKIFMFVGVAGATLTAGQCFAGIYNSAGTRVAVTNDQSGTWNSIGAKSMALVANPTLEPGDYYVAWVSNGTTPPQFAGLTSGVSGQLISINTVAPFRNSTSAAGGNTSLPSSVTLGTNNLGAAITWAGLG